jgi:predicted nucleotidyltransferase
LGKIQSEENFKILYACESGSRAWRFPSSDSDYDVRYIYIRRPEFYLSIDEGRDVVECDIIDDIDLRGWDLKKALKLFRKSNPPLLEWLQSPIVYMKQYTVSDQLRALLPIYYSPISCMHHYTNMAEGNLRDYIRNDKVWLKKYFYVLRPVLACNWIENDFGPVPTEFDKLVEAIIKDKALKSSISDLIRKKRDGQELSWGNKIPEISDYIEKEIVRLKKKEFHFIKKITDTEKLNKLFRSALNEVW